MLSNHRRNEIISLHKFGMTNNAISEKLQIHTNTVSMWINRFYEYDSIIEMKHLGRNKKTTNEQDKKIIELAKNNKNIKTEDIVNEMKNDVIISRMTICRILKENNIVYGEFKRKPYLTDEQKMKRFEWALKHRFYNWSNVIYSDESSFWKDKNHNKCWYEIGNQKIKLSKSHSIKFHVWGCITLGDFRFSIFSKNLNADRYIEILFENLITIYSNEYVFQQDNSSVHKSKKVKNFLNRENIDVLEFPANSPDVNPIENIWAIIKHNISKIEDLTNDNFEEKILECCRKVNYQSIFNSISNMHVRVQDIIDKKGDITDY